MQAMSSALLGATSEVLATAAATWMAYLARMATVCQVPGGVPLPSEAEAKMLLDAGMGPLLVPLVQQQLQASLEQQAVPAFWAALRRCQAAAAAGDARSLEAGLLTALQDLCAVVDSHCACLQHLANMLAAALARTGGAGAAAPPPASPSAFAFPPSGTGMDLAEGGGPGGYGSGYGAGWCGAQPLQLAVAALWRLPERYRATASALLVATADVSVSELLLQYYSSKLQQLASELAPEEQLMEERDCAEAAAAATAALGSGATSSDANHLDWAAVATDLLGWEAGQRTAVATPKPGAATADNGHSPMEADNDENARPARRLSLAPSAVAARMGEPWVRRLVAVSSCLSRLALGPAGEEAVSAAVSRHVVLLLQRLAKDTFDREVLPAASRAAGRVPLEFLRLVVAGDGAEGGLAERGAEGRTLQEWCLRLTYYVYEALGLLRIGQMFEIVVEYPDSLPAVRDLAACLRHTNLQPTFVAAFRGALQQRLLHAGASATGIIHQYVATIRTLREVDPSGALLQAVAQPVREYLRGRADTIKCLVSMVTQDGGGPSGESLLEELQSREGPSAGGAGMMDVDGGDGLMGGAQAQDGDEAVLRVALATAHAGSSDAHASAASAMAAATQMAAAVAGGAAAAPAAQGGAAGAAAASPSVAAAAADIVGMLIGVFGSPELFINEYRALLASQLLARSDYDTARELRTMELLKMRFGEGALHACEVMLKDLADSKRINHNVHNISAAGAPPGTGPGPGGAASGTPPRSSQGPAAAAAAGRGAASAPPGTAAAAAAAGAAPGASTPPPAGRGAGPQLPARASPMTRQQQRLRQQQQQPGDTGVAATASGGAGGGAHSPPADESATAAAFGLLSATVISYLFWPKQDLDPTEGPAADPAAKLQPPPEVRAAMACYNQRYSHLKTPRKLLWRPHQGLVELELLIGGVSLEARVSPLLATLLLAFRERQAMAAAELAAETGLPVALVRRKMLFWVNHGIVSETRARQASTAGAPAPAAGGRVSTGVCAAAGSSVSAGAADQQDVLYHRASEVALELQGAVLSDVGLEDETPAQLPSASDKVAEEMAPYENYIIGMLTNYGGLPLDRLHNMLRMFVVSPKYDKAPEQLAAFLQLLIGRDKVLLDNGVYRKKGPGARV